MRRRTTLTLGRALSTVLCLALGSGAPAVAAKVERLEIVDRAIAYHGGDAYESSEMRFQLCSKSGCSSVRTRVDGGLFDHEVAAQVRGAERRVRITNESVEWWLDGEPQPIASGREQALRDWVMSKLYFALLPYRLNDPSALKEDLGLEEWGGRSLHRVRVTFEPGTSTHAQDQFLFWFDPESGRLEQVAYSYVTDGGGLRFRRTIDHRRIGDVRFFDQENWGVDGPGLSVDLIDPEYVESEMRHVSTVRLDQIQIGRL